MQTILNQDSQELLVQRRFLQFLLEFKIADERSQTYQYYYMEEATRIASNDRTTLFLNYGHLQSYEGYSDLANSMVQEFYRFEPYFRKAVQEFVFRVTNENQDDRVYFLSVFNMQSVEKIRDLRASKIGHLLAFQGTVTRSSEVRPELISGTFHCLMCPQIIRNVEQQFKFTQPKKCTNIRCDNRSRWRLDMQKSTFTDYQKVRVQEDPKEIPAGSMPRSIEVVLHNEICDAARPGDKCIFVGSLTVVPDIYSLSKPGEKSVLAKGTSGEMQRGQTQDGITGLKQLGVRDLSYKHIFLATFVESTSNRFDLIRRDASQYPENEDDGNQAQREQAEGLKQFSEEELQEVERMKQTPDLYKNLAQSIAPAVFGHEEVKKGILLMLLGGVNKKTKEGVNIRGDINVCIVGDPSTAKSQFLKFTCSFLPRAVYTSGKASSAAGLTASVHRDPETGEFTIEAGALMLADNGVCCIDEFDKVFNLTHICTKMDSKDQVAIHEAMEQQTISIAKAGIHATLNARASILAAANPIFGRYDRSKTLKFNVNMTQPIMSRFDLFFVITDQSMEFIDHQIATHIVKLHSQLEKAIDPTFSTDGLRRYIRFARNYKPILSREAAEHLKHSYIRLRQNDQTTNKASYRITVRQLESLIRLSEALARVYCDDEIKVPHVKEAERLLSQSQITVERPDIECELDDELLNLDKPRDNIIQEELRIREEEERRKKNKIQISSDEYYQISKALLGYFKQKQQEREDEIVETQGICQQDAVEWFIEQRIDTINTEEEMQTLAKLLHTIIGNLIRREKLLVVVKDDSDFTRRELLLHTNYSE